MWKCLPAVRAHRLLHDPEMYSRMNAEGVYQACIDAGYSEEAAQKAGTKRAQERAEQDLPL